MQFGAKVVRHHKLIFWIAVILLLPSLFGMLSTGINYDMLSYLPEDMETMEGQNLLLDEFGKGGFSIIVMENMKTREISEFKNKVSEVPHVDSIVNLADVLNPAMPMEMLPEAIRSNIKNEDASMMVVFFDTATSANETLDAIDEINSIANEDTYVAGMGSLVLDLKKICESEEVKYVIVAVIVSLVTMMLLLDSYIAPFLFLASIGMAILYNMGSNIVFGEISFITMAIAAVLQLGVTMDFSIFLWHSYMEKLDEGLDEEEAMALSINDTLTSVTGSSITTIAGFLALCFMTYTMGKDLGIVMAKGVAFGVIASVTILPAMLLKFSKILRRTRHKTLLPDFAPAVKRISRRCAPVLIIFVLLVGPAVYGYQHDNITYDFTSMISNGAEKLDASMTTYTRANEKLRDDFGIANSYIVIADASMREIEGKAMSNELKAVDGVTSVIGKDALLGTSIPLCVLPGEIGSSLASDKHQMMLINSGYKVSTDECNEQIDSVNSIVKKYDPTAMVIGEGPATKDLINITSDDFRTVNLISIALVFIIIMLVLKSAVLPVLLVAAIEFAIYVNLGIPGYTGLELPFIVPVLVSTIQLGSTVDYAILMSTRYKSERVAGATRDDAIGIAATTSIPSIIVSGVGFFAATIGVSLYSNIAIISTICALMARGALISMLTVILVVPSLLKAFDGIICKTTIGMRGINNARFE